MKKYNLTALIALTFINNAAQGMDLADEGAAPPPPEVTAAPPVPPVNPEGAAPSPRVLPAASAPEYITSLYSKLPNIDTFAKRMKDSNYDDNRPLRLMDAMCVYLYSKKTGEGDDALKILEKFKDDSLVVGDPELKAYIHGLFPSSVPAVSSKVSVAMGGEGGIPETQSDQILMMLNKDVDITNRITAAIDVYKNSTTHKGQALGVLADLMMGESTRPNDQIRAAYYVFGDASTSPENKNKALSVFTMGMQDSRVFSENRIIAAIYVYNDSTTSKDSALAVLAEHMQNRRATPNNRIKAARRVFEDKNTLEDSKNLALDVFTACMQNRRATPNNRIIAALYVYKHSTITASKEQALGILADMMFDPSINIINRIKAAFHVFEDKNTLEDMKNGALRLLAEHMHDRVLGEDQIIAALCVYQNSTTHKEQALGILADMMFDPSLNVRSQTDAAICVYENSTTTHKEQASKWLRDILQKDFVVSASDLAAEPDIVANFRKKIKDVLGEEESPETVPASAPRPVVVLNSVSPRGGAGDPEIEAIADDIATMQNHRATDLNRVEAAIRVFNHKDSKKKDKNAALAVLDEQMIRPYNPQNVSHKAKAAMCVFEHGGTTQKFEARGCLEDILKMPRLDAELKKEIESNLNAPEGGKRRKGRPS